MLEKILRIIQKIVPKSVYRFFQPMYHFSLAIIGAVIYNFPGKKIHVIAVTGTKGKSSTSEFLNAILEEAQKENKKEGNEEKNGYKSALLSTIRFKVGNESRPNMYKMTMPGRLFVQQFLRKAVDANCKYAIIEMTSEGARFYRHMFTYPDTLIFTNLSPEHIESHGSFNAYKACKLQLAKAVEKSRKIITTIVANTSDKYGREFLNFNVDKKIEYTVDESKNVRLEVDGDFNKLNALACKKFALSVGISEQIIDKALLELKEIPGRVQHIHSEKKQDFEVIVDYAHTVESLTKLYSTYNQHYIVAVTGACGGGRDKKKRPELGSVAYEYCNEVIVTDEDPYDDDPREIMNDVMAGVMKGVIIYDNKKDKIELDEKYRIIENRREAIHYAMLRAKKYINTLPTDIIKASNIIPKKPIVIISGKGTDPYIMRANGTKERWSDAKVAKEELEKILNQ